MSAVRQDPYSVQDAPAPFNVPPVRYVAGPGLPARAFYLMTEPDKQAIAHALNAAHRAGARAVRHAMLDALGLHTWGRDVSVKEGA